MLEDEKGPHLFNLVRICKSKLIVLDLFLRPIAIHITYHKNQN